MCAIFGVLDYKGSLDAAQRFRMVKVLGTAAEVRGTDATGIAFFRGDKLCIQKAPKPAHKMKYHIPVEARYIMGHTRMTTQGTAERNRNNHPFSGKAGKQSFALAHNGVLHNDQLLRQEYLLPETAIETDSYIAVQLIEQQRELSFSSLKEMAEVLDGAFTFTILDQDNNLYFVKGSNPLTIYHYPKLGLYLYASTEEILMDARKGLGLGRMRPKIIKPWPGDILRINRYGDQEYAQFNMFDPFSTWNMRQSVSSFRPKHLSRPHTSRSEYIRMLKSVAGFYGYESCDIDALLADGYTTEDIEDMIYCERM